MLVLLVGLTVSIDLVLRMKGTSPVNFSNTRGFCFVWLTLSHFDQ